MGSGVFIKHGRSTALYEITAHGHDDEVRLSQFSGFFDLIGMSLMKGIILCNDTDNAHEILLALRFAIVDIISQT